MNEVLYKKYKYLLDKLDTYACGKTVLFWGRHESLSKIVRDYGYEVIEVTYIKDNVSSEVKWIEDYAFKQNEYFMVIPYLAINDKRNGLLQKLGYGENDRSFLVHDKISMISTTDTKYVDEFNNSICTKSKGIKIVLQEGTTNCDIEIGENIAGNPTIYITGPSVSIKIGSNVQFKNNFLYFNIGSSLNIGDKCTFNSETNIYITNCSRVDIGEDCMFSFGAIIHCGDGHSIFDKKTGKRLNKIANNITIGNHVWCGFRANILAPTVIGDDSIIGAASLVKGVFESNCVLAGTPARTIRRDVTWDRSNSKDFLFDEPY